MTSRWPYARVPTCSMVRHPTYPARKRVPAPHWAVETATKIKNLIKWRTSTGILIGFPAI
ncbi:MAG TPA: hypothetical protein QF597_02550 [Arenicellales bacterium]|nr:hypothetical protein [Arenicellales bacterium]